MRRWRALRQKACSTSTSHRRAMHCTCEGNGSAPSRAGRKIVREALNDVVGLRTALAGWMPETAGANPVMEVENHVVVMIRRRSHRHRIQMQLVPHLPRDHVIRAGCVTTEAQPANNAPVSRIKRKSTREND